MIKVVAKTIYVLIFVLHHRKLRMHGTGSESYRLFDAANKSFRRNCLERQVPRCFR